MNIRSRRQRWFLAFAAGLLAVCTLLALSSRDMTVVVYNDSDEDFQHLTVSVGKENTDIAVLHSQESMALHFRAVTLPSDVKLYIETEPPFQWNAPGLVTPAIAHITLRVGNGRIVTASLEQSWTHRLSRMLE